MSRKLHVRCVRCRYDLYGLRDSEKCPECGLPLSHSFNEARLLFAPRGLLRRLQLGLVLGLAYHGWSMIISIFGWQLTHSYELQEVLRSAGNILGASALIVLFTAWAAKPSRFWRVVIAFLLGGATLLLAVLTLIQCQYWLELAPRPADSMIRRFLILARHGWDVPSWVAGIIGTVAVLSYHLVVRSFIARVPSRRWSRILLVTATLIAGNTIAAIQLPEEYSGTLLASFFILLVLATWILSVCAVVASLGLVLSTIRERRALYVGRGPSSGT